MINRLLLFFPSFYAVVSLSGYRLQKSSLCGIGGVFISFLFVWFVSFSASFDQPPEGEHERSVLPSESLRSFVILWVVCVCACVRACVRACVCVCACVRACL